ncbi:tubulin polyglutamylase ttll6-like [Cylas formicarius]|uniref:tubulin polyglutamylase ttll6-like n=1 Tax=Cylas formicarius TaxID=197179 RepID=UPI002958672A|nr:tubulin polyglutamylase ttll6-like [Cylas formicarius]
MASDSTTSVAPNENSDSSIWSSDYENNRPIAKNATNKLSDVPEKKRHCPPSEKKGKGVSICLTHCRYDVIRKMVQRFNFKEASEGENWNMYWTDLSITVERCKEMKRFQKINHFPGMLEICRKDLLARNLNRMNRLFPRDYNFFPKTWCLPADLGDAMAYSRLRRNKTFILKPDAGSQGRGIVITKSLKDVRPCDKGICQVYIARPFLIDGYKFDLRVYALITSCDPLRIYVYDEGLVRFATAKYKEPNGVNFTNVFMHLTNYAVNKHSRMYNQDLDGAGSKRKLSWLKNHLLGLNYDVDAIWCRMDDVIVKTIVSAYPVLKHSYAACFPNHDVVPACCELLGVDIIFDKRMNPQVLEVNHSPSFHTDTQLDCEVKEALLSDMFAMLNLDKCDKRRVMREDRKRIRERLIHGHKDHQVPCVEVKCFDQHFKNEMAARGRFRLVYPLHNSSSVYGRFFEQNLNTLYCDTASSRAREAAQNALRDEMQLKARLEAAKRISPIPKQSRPPSQGLSKTRKPLLTIKSSEARNSFEPQPIIESEEKERLRGLAEREHLLKSHGIVELVYFSLKQNKAIRPEDARKYCIFEKFRNASQMVNKGGGPYISDIFGGIDGKKGVGREVEAVTRQSERVHNMNSIYTEIDRRGNANLKLLSTFGVD